MFVVLTLLHVMIVTTFPNIGLATNKYSENIDKAQRFYYNDDDSVLVGTSLASGIIQDSISPVKLMAFAGTSPQDGLKIILSRERLPKVVFIETNLLYQEESNEVFTNKVTNGYMAEIKRYIPSLREQYTPMNIFNWILKEVILGGEKVSSREVNLNVLNGNIERMVNSDKCLESDVLKERRKNVRQLVENLQKAGVHVVFFEMPVNKKVVNLRMFEQNREASLEDFPQTVNTWIPNDTSIYITSDGMHLDMEGKERYSHYIKQCIATL